MDNMKDSPQDKAGDMNFIPSKVDEPESIQLPGSGQPEGFWVIEKGDMDPFFPDR
jgi:hypothetical protein